ncbi:MAG: hypothetical protein SNF68_07290 [Rikenellaceae bacterium]
MDELKQLKTEVASLERKIQLSLAPPKDGVQQQEISPTQNPTTSENNQRIIFARVAPPVQSKGVKLI